MAKIKIIELLKSLSSDELKLLDKFVKSPAHNKHAQVVSLFKYIRKNIDKPSDLIYGDKLYKYVFPNSPIEMQKLHHVSSYLFKTVEEFLSWHEWKTNETNQKIELLKSYKRLKQPQLFYKTFDNALGTLLNSHVKNDRFYTQRFQLEEIRLSQMRTDSKNKDYRLQELSNAQDEAFIIQKLKTACLLLSNQALSKETYDLGLIPYIISLCEHSEYLNNPTLSIYFHASKALFDFQDDHAFRTLKSLLIQHWERFETAELYDIYIFAINYCINKLNKGEQVFMREVFDIYQSGLEVGVFLEEGMLAPRTYSNIVMSGLRLGEFEAVENFIYDYKAKLPEKQREGFFNYNLAHLFYEKNNYHAAMPLLLKIDTRDTLHLSTSKTLLAKMYFELNEIESLNSLLQSFRIFIKRKQMIGYHKEGYLNFIKYVHKLLNLKNSREKEETINEILSTQILPEKKWLLAQLKKHSI